MIVDVDFGAKHFCGNIFAQVRYAKKATFWATAKLVIMVLQKCFAPKSISTILFQLIVMLINQNLLL